MTHLLPPNLLRLFAPRAPLPFAKPLGRDPAVPIKENSQFTGVAALLETIKQEAAEHDASNESNQRKLLKTENDENKMQEDVKPNGEVAAAPKPKAKGKLKRQPKPAKAKVIAPTPKAKGKKTKVHGSKPIPAPTEAEKKATEEGISLTEQEKVEARAEERKKRKEERLERMSADKYDPNKDVNATGDPYKTLFISRLAPETTEEDLRKEFDMYGRIEKLTLVRDVVNGKSKRYAFILYDREKDMKAAYKDADGLKIHGKRILVDVERGRTVKGWKPMRLGGGLGGQPKPIVHDPYRGFAPRGRGGFRGGFGDRGGFRGGRGGGFGGDRGGFRGGPPRDGGFGGPPRDGGFSGPPRDGYGGPPPGGFNGPPPGQGYGPPPGAFGGGGGPPRGQGIGYGPPSHQGPPPQGFVQPQGGAFGGGGGGPPPMQGGYGQKRDYDQGPPRGSYGGGYDDRDAKRPRY